jgi:hypothetical protein
MVVRAETGRNLQPKCKAMPTPVGVWWAFAKNSKASQEPAPAETREGSKFWTFTPWAADSHFVRMAGAACPPSISERLCSRSPEKLESRPSQSPSL